MRVLLVVLLVFGSGFPAEAHVSDRAFVLLLPTHLYVWGGALAVAFSFAVMALVPVAPLRVMGRVRWRLIRLPVVPNIAFSLLSLGILLCLIIAGFAGSRDPLSNPLPMVIWTLWWVGFTLAHAAFGNLWAAINPWRGLYLIVIAVFRLDRWRKNPLFTYPTRLGFLPAIILFFAFSWFELVYISPQDPDLLATAVIAYAGLTLTAMAAFGARDWLYYGEAFSVFFRVVSWLSPLSPRPRDHDDGDDTARWLTLAVPGRSLLDLGVVRLSGLAFIVLVLSSVSFDGLSRTFLWVDLAGENPLEFPGRSAVVGLNTFGLLATFCALLTVYVSAVLVGRQLGGFRETIVESLGRYVVSIVPIAFGYHFAHYLPAFIVDGQYAVRAASDPLALGWNLFGTAGMHVHAAILSNHASVQIVYNLQVAGIVAAHVMAVVIAHVLAVRQADTPKQAILSQIPMTALMIGYTVFGLWLLSSPTVG